jgi:hypothetical protein
MSAMGHEQTSRHVRVMSVIPLKADIHQRGLHVRLGPRSPPTMASLSVARILDYATTHINLPCPR